LPMTDTVDPAIRSRIMSHVRAKDTKPELALRRALWAAGLRGWRCHVRSVAGTPDLAWKNRKLAVFVDSAWWHGHESRWKPGRLPAAWDKKIQGNRDRDATVSCSLEGAGWIVIRVWDFEIDRDLAGCVSRVSKALASRSQTATPSTATNEQGGQTDAAREAGV
jgi:DNA mismatch endonuclease (patch repair protein)